jgi:hypothetical protein
MNLQRLLVLAAATPRSEAVGPEPLRSDIGLQKLDRLVKGVSKLLGREVFVVPKDIWNLGLDGVKDVAAWKYHTRAPPGQRVRSRQYGLSRHLELMSARNSLDSHNGPFVPGVDRPVFRSPVRYGHAPSRWPSRWP